MIPRRLHLIEAITKDTAEDYDNEDPRARWQTAPADIANTVSSVIAVGGNENTPDDEEAENVWHAPVLDIDYPAALIPSSTPGRFHLYLDRPVPWPAYRRLIEALADAGIIELGYAEASIARRATYVRRPEVTKPKAQSAMLADLAASGVPIPGVTPPAVDDPF